MKVIKWAVIILAILGIGGYAWFNYMVSETKKASPEAKAKFKERDLELAVSYCRPYKKERKIFGELVPYGEVWRTGANEATTFSTSKDISFGGEAVAAGEYSLWTIPEETEWTVILNSKAYPWGVGWDGKATREAEFDVANVKVPVGNTAQTVEQFSISFSESGNMVFEWDNVRTEVRID